MKRFLSATSLTALLCAGAVAAQEAPTGFSISLNGDAIAGDPVVRDTARKTDIALANADVQVVFDGLGADPRLDVEVVGGRAAGPGDTVTLQSVLNYPAFVSRGEMRIVDLDAPGGPRVIQTLPVDPNGQVTLTLPEGEALAVRHRVYDSAGRYDETAPLPLFRSDSRGLIDGVEDGSSSLSRQAIPVTGGAVTVSGSNVAPGASVTALGERVVPDRDGGFVIQRILPAGDYGVDVRVSGAGQNVDLVREITIPGAEWFYVATADLTFGYRTDGLTGERDTYRTGRLAGFVDGKTAGGYRITGSVDTGEGDLSTLFDDLDERDPRQLFLRVDPRDLYPTYGDDSTLVDATPTSGKLFLRIERDANYVQWGDFKADLGDNAFVRNDRTHYGASGALVSQATTARGAPRAQIRAHAAQPDRLPQRDTFQGTGGSTFFLGKQDIAQASETVSIQLRDPDTGRVIETRALTPGEDYAINYIQGIVTLTRPLSPNTQDGLFNIGSPRRDDLVLVVAYEHDPGAAELDGYAFGGRAEVWASDALRLGVSVMEDETGITDHRVQGADILLSMSDQTFVRLDYAESEGTGFDGTFSADGGLIVEDVLARGSRGTALKLTAQADLAELGLGVEGSVAAYVEERGEGFSSLDTTVTAATGDETFYGLAADVALADGVKLLAGFDHYENAAGDRRTDGTAQVEVQATDRIAVAVGVEHQDNTGSTRPGQRTDVAAQLTYGLGEDRSVYVFGQTTVDRVGLPANDRVGVGLSYGFGNGWSVAAEVSDGDLGRGGRVLVENRDGNGNSRYIGWELDPGRELDGITLAGRDRGRVIAGATQQVGANVSMFGETTTDLFGRYQSLTSRYGLTYSATEALSFTGTFEMGQSDDGAGYDFARRALTLGLLYEDDRLSAAGRVEYRVEDGLRAGVDVKSDTLLVKADAEYKLDEASRLVLSADVARSDTAQSALLDGDYSDIVLGYGYRPVDNDRLNLLARYRYLHDAVGLRDATGDEGPRQRSHVFSIDATYEVSERWTLGGKFGYRSAETALAGEDDFARNDAWLAVASARFHAVREWDALLEVRQLTLVDAGTDEASALAAIYREVGDNLRVGVGYNFGTFSDDLTDLTADDEGAFFNIIAKF